MLCEDFDPDNLDWQSFHETTGCLVGGNFIRPHDPLALDLRYWGIHAADEQLVALAVAGCKKRLEGREENIRQEQRRLEESASFLRLKYICIGATLGAIASLFGQWILTP
jgi:hypothetical protein